MSNIFNNELRLSIKGVYTELETRELVHKNVKKGAKLSVYYAHGATDNASD